MKHDWVIVPAAPLMGLPKRYKCRLCWIESGGLDSLNGSRGYFPPCGGTGDRKGNGRDPIGLLAKDILPEGAVKLADLVVLLLR